MWVVSPLCTLDTYEAQSQLHPWWACQIADIDIDEAAASSEREGSRNQKTKLIVRSQVEEDLLTWQSNTGFSWSCSAFNSSLAPLAAIQSVSSIWCATLRFLRCWHELSGMCSGLQWSEHHAGSMAPLLWTYNLHGITINFHSHCGHWKRQACTHCHNLDIAVKDQMLFFSLLMCAIVMSTYNET